MKNKEKFEQIYWRGSISDFGTDIGYLLTEDQIDELIQNLKSDYQTNKRKELKKENDL